MGCQGAQDLRQLVSAEFAPSARAMRKRRKPNLRHRNLLSPRLRLQFGTINGESTRPSPRSGLKIREGTGILENYVR